MLARHTQKGFSSALVHCARKSVPEFVRKAAADPDVDASTRQASTFRMHHGRLLQ